MIVRESIQIRRGVSIDGPLNVGSRDLNSTPGGVIKGLSDNFSYLEFHRVRGNEILFDYTGGNYFPKILKDIQKWIEDNTNYESEVESSKNGRMREIKIQVF